MLIVVFEEDHGGVCLGGRNRSGLTRTQQDLTCSSITASDNTTRGSRS